MEQKRNYNARGPRTQAPREERFIPPIMTALALKLILNTRLFCASKDMAVVHYAVYDDFVMASMIGLKRLPKDAISQVRPELNKHGYCLVRIDAKRYALLRLAQLSRWTKVGNRFVKDMPNDARILTEKLDEALRQGHEA